MFGEGPPPRLASLAYDATAIAAVFVQEDGSFDPRQLVTRQGFGGKDGIFRFTKVALLSEDRLPSTWHR